MAVVKEVEDTRSPARKHADAVKAKLQNELSGHQHSATAIVVLDLLTEAAELVDADDRKLEEETRPEPAPVD